MVVNVDKTVYFINNEILRLPPVAQDDKMIRNKKIPVAFAFKRKPRGYILILVTPFSGVYCHLMPGCN